MAALITTNSPHTSTRVDQRLTNGPISCLMVPVKVELCPDASRAMPNSTLAKGPPTGMYAFAAFCLTLALTLPRWGGWAFVMGVAVSLLMLLVTKRMAAPKRSVADPCQKAQR